MAQVFVSIGSNIDRARSVRFGVAALQREFGTLQLSPVYETRAVGFEGEDFYNLVAGFATSQSPRQVVDRLHAIEAACGRERQQERFASRTLDIDLLLYDDLDLHDQGMNVPRDEIPQYAFVLKPLVDLIPDRRHPLTGECYRDLWQAMREETAGLRRIDFEFDTPDE